MPPLPLPPPPWSLTRIVAAPRISHENSWRELVTLDEPNNVSVFLSSPLNSYRLPISDRSQLSNSAFFPAPEWKLACWQHKITLSSFSKRLETLCCCCCDAKCLLKGHYVFNRQQGECTGAGRGAACVSPRFDELPLSMRCRRKTFTIFFYMTLAVTADRAI